MRRAAAARRRAAVSRRRRLHVVRRIKVGSERCDAASRSPAASAASALRARTGVVPTPKNTSRTSPSALPAARAVAARPGHGVVAMPARELRKADARLARRHRNADRGQHVARRRARSRTGPCRSRRPSPCACRKGPRSRPRHRARAGRRATRRPDRRRRSSRRWCRGCGSPDARYAAAPWRSAARGARSRPSARPARGGRARRSRARRYFNAMRSSPGTRLMSTRSCGRLSRMLSVAIRLCPPASTRASGSLPSSSIA